ncbi:MAG: hypothetical protein RQ756_09350, partial [Flavobacteriaceae bacterium]|nr:hypothetical protein [Flavobacteriaceae bacterium]
GSLINQYPYNNLSIIELAYVCREIAHGHYGELYESINLTKVMRCINKYLEERMYTASQLSQNQHRAFKEVPENQFIQAETQDEGFRQYLIKRKIDQANQNNTNDTNPNA